MDISDLAKSMPEGYRCAEMEGKCLKTKPEAVLVKREETELEISSKFASALRGIDSSCSRASFVKNPSGGAQFIIFYNGSVNVYDAVPPEKAQAIMLLATAAAGASDSSGIKKSASREGCMARPNVAGAASLELTRSLLRQNSSTETSLLPAQLLTNPSPSLCKLHAELPGARKHSLQRFLEKRRDRRTIDVAGGSPFKPALQGILGINMDKPNRLI